MRGSALKRRKTKGCNLYDPQGIPYVQPCKFGAGCWYIHPNEPEWSDLEWSGGVGFLRNSNRNRSRSRSREGRRSRSSVRPRSSSRGRDAGWDRARLDRERGKERERHGELERSRDERSQDRDDRDRDRERRPKSPSSSRRLPSPRSRRGRRDRDRSSRPSSTSSSRPRRDSIASSAGGDPPPTTASTTTGQPRTPPRGPRSATSDTFLLRSPEERKPDLRELERARLQGRAKQVGRREVIDLRDPVSGPSTTRTPIAASPPPPGLSVTSTSFSFPRMSVPPPPRDIPPPTPTESPLLPPPAMMMNVDSPLVQSPPPLPQAPDFEDILQDEELIRGTWDARVHLLTDLVGLSSEMEDVQSDLETIRLLAESSTMLPEESRGRLRERLGQAEAKLHAKQAEYERLRDKNVYASEMWPIAREQMEHDMTLLSAYKEMVGYLADLKKVANDLQRELGLLGVGKIPEVPVVEALKEDVDAKMRENEEREKEKAVPPPPPPPPLPSRKRDEDAMQIDDVPQPPPPLPYRPSIISTPSLPPAAPPLPHRPASERTISQRDLDEISSRLDGIEKDLGAIDDTVWQRENELRDEFRVELEGKAQELYAFVKGGGKPPRTKEGSEEDNTEEGDDEEVEEDDVGHGEDPEVAALQKKIHEMGVQTKDSVKEVDEMTEILENFQTRLELTERQQPEEVSEYQAALKRNIDLHNRLAALEATDRSSSTTIETLQNTLRVHITAQPPSPPSSPAPSLPSASLLLHFFREPMKAELRKAIVPIIEDVRAGVKMQVEEEARGVYATVWERVEGSVRVLGSVERVLAQGVNGVNAVNGVNGVNGTGSH